MNYIVKNCPCYNKDYSCQSKDNIAGKYCQDYTDCVIKQVIEKCKDTCKKRCANDCLGTKRYCGYGEILQLFDIEVQNERQL